MPTAPSLEAKALEGLDLTGIEIIGEAWGEANIEKAAALKPDLIIAEYWPLDKTWSGGDDLVAALKPIARSPARPRATRSSR